MNLMQLLQRWPAKEGRLFFLGSGKDADRLPVYYTICDHWRKKSDSLDFTRLHSPTLQQISEACRADPVVGKHRVVCATECKWPPDEPEPGWTKEQIERQRASLLNIVANLPRDLVLIMSTPADKPKTDNDLAQAIIRKGYWVVLTNPDEETASSLLESLTQWPEELCREVVSIQGTSPAQILSLARTARLAFENPTEDDIHSLVSRTQKGHVFELTEAIIQRNAVAALELASAEDVPAGQLVGALDRKLTTLLQFMAEMKKGRTPRDAAAALKMPGFLVHGLYEASKRWNSREILQTWPILAEAAINGDKHGGTDLIITSVLGIE